MSYVRLFSRASAPAGKHQLSTEAANMASDGKVGELRLLLSAAPAMVRLADKHGFTLLMHASGEGHVEVVRLLLELKCDVNAINTPGNTALHLCASMGYIACVAALLQGGANPALAGRDGKTAADLARALGHESCVALLEGKGGGAPPDATSAAAGDGDDGDESAAVADLRQIERKEPASPAPVAKPQAGGGGAEVAAPPRANGPHAAASAGSSSGGTEPRDLAYALLDADLTAIDADGRDELRTVLEMVLENLRQAEGGGGEGDVARATDAEGHHESPSARSAPAPAASEVEYALN